MFRGGGGGWVGLGVEMGMFRGGMGRFRGGDG